MSELADEPIRIVAHDPAWPARFEEERAALEVAIGPWVTGGILHVGSTAVPRLDAKPIIDILVGVRDLETSRACFEPLAELDYLYAPYLTDAMHWFCKPDPARRTHHLHLVPTGSERYREELAFRDRLRADQRPPRNTPPSSTPSRTNSRTTARLIRTLRRSSSGGSVGRFELGDHREVAHVGG